MDLTNDQLRTLSHGQLLEQFMSMRDEFNEYQTSSTEMEKIMDSEIEDLRNQMKRLDSKYQQMVMEQERSKGRQEESRLQWTQVEEQLRRENGQLREQNDHQKETIRRLEQKNDVLERSDRNKEFMASDLGTKLDNAIEKIAMLDNKFNEIQRAKEDSRTIMERPHLIVEPLRNEHKELTPDEPSPGSSKPQQFVITDHTTSSSSSSSAEPQPMDGCMEGGEEKMDETQVVQKMEGIQIVEEVQPAETNEEVEKDHVFLMALLCNEQYLEGFLKIILKKVFEDSEVHKITTSVNNTIRLFSTDLSPNDEEIVLVEKVINDYPLYFANSGLKNLKHLLLLSHVLLRLGNVAITDVLVWSVAIVAMKDCLIRNGLHFDIMEEDRRVRVAWIMSKEIGQAVELIENVHHAFVSKSSYVTQSQRGIETARWFVTQMEINYLDDRNKMKIIEYFNK